MVEEVTPQSVPSCTASRGPPGGSRSSADEYPNGFEDFIATSGQRNNQWVPFKVLIQGWSPYGAPRDTRLKLPDATKKIKEIYEWLPPELKVIASPISPMAQCFRFEFKVVCGRDLCDLVWNFLRNEIQKLRYEIEGKTVLRRNILQLGNHFPYVCKALRHQQDVVCEPQVRQRILRIINHYPKVLARPPCIQGFPFRLELAEAYFHDGNKQQPTYRVPFTPRINLKGRD